MFKQSIILTTALCMSFASLCGYKSDNAEPEGFSGGAVAGAGITTLNPRPTALAQVGYYDTCWMFDVGANFSHASGRNHFTYLLGHLGARNRVCQGQNLFVSYGVMGEGAVGPHVKNAWGVGAFVGLDYQLARHFLLTGKVYPYNYAERSHNSVFANGTISLFYVF